MCGQARRPTSWQKKGRQASADAMFDRKTAVQAFQAGMIDQLVAVAFNAVVQKDRTAITVFLYFASFTRDYVDQE